MMNLMDSVNTNGRMEEFIEGNGKKVYLNVNYKKLFCFNSRKNARVWIL
jgi:hypothetical protein